MLNDKYELQKLIEAALPDAESITDISFSVESQTLYFNWSGFKYSVTLDLCCGELHNGFFTGSSREKLMQQLIRTRYELEAKALS